ncbi:MAG: hypothetical protein J6P73_05490 [Bacteroidales bacterium]|nr:hypothetical protein [Bacteroidales bacterium]
MKKGMIILFCGWLSSYAQTADTLRTHVDSLQVVRDNIEYLYQLFVEQAEDRDDMESTDMEASEADYEELLLAYQYYLENPVNINSDDIVFLEELGLLNPFQTETIRKYRRQFGDFLFHDELLMLDAFNETSMAVIAPLVYFGKSEKTLEREQITPRKMLTRGKHQVTLNYAEKFSGETNEDYLGSPRKLQFKYAYSFKQKLKFGIAMEKDAGEPFLFSRLDDTLKEAVKQCRSPGFDFYGTHLYFTDIKLKRNTEPKGPMVESGALIIKDLAFGDYQLSFGQGLTLWSGMSYGKASGGSSPMKRAPGVRPKTSSGEGKFFRGAATTLKYNDFYATAFYSNRKIDATVSVADSLDEPELVSALQETGYHRTLNELTKRNAIRQQVFGGHLCYAGPNLEIGYTVYHLKLSAPLELKPSKYNQYYFSGDRLTDMGLDFRWLLNHFVFFGELARSDNGTMAGLIGMTVKPKGYIDFSLLYRNYDKRYQSLFHGAFGESSRGQGEEGVYLGLQCAPAPSWNLIAYCDFFRLKWLTSQVYNPSWGQEYSLKVSHQISKNATMQVRFKSKTKMKNSSDDHVYSHYPVFYTKRSLNFQVSYGISKALTFSNKAAYTHYFNDDEADSRGYLVCHDVSYKPPNQPFTLTFRYALFDSDDYNSRVSVYENDVLGAFSIPSLNGVGTRIYLLAKIKLLDHLNVYSRIGFLFLSEETKTDVKAEVIWKF